MEDLLGHRSPQLTVPGPLQAAGMISAPEDNQWLQICGARPCTQGCAGSILINLHFSSSPVVVLSTFFTAPGEGNLIQNPWFCGTSLHKPVNSWPAVPRPPPTFYKPLLTPEVSHSLVYKWDE